MSHITGNSSLKKRAHFSDVSASSGGAVPSVPVKSPSSPGFCSRSSSVLRDRTCLGVGNQPRLTLPQLTSTQSALHLQRDERPSPAVINSMEQNDICQQ